MKTDLEVRQVNTIRALALDAVKMANSGHSGTAMALAPLAHVLFTKILKYDSSDPNWLDRDRLVLSAGHASMLLYAALHLTGYDLSLEDIKQFRQWNSITPGHPETGITPGVEVTTGPLGQGLANAVGMAIAERNLRSRLGPELVDHFTYVIVGDGDLMEGISHEAASLAGHQGLNRLIAIYDDNRITIDGPTGIAFSDDSAARFKSYGWHVEELGDVSEDIDGLTSALERCKAETNRPSIIVVQSHIGFPAPNAVDTPAAHGAITSADEIAAAKTAMGLDSSESFSVSEEVMNAYLASGSRGSSLRAQWESRLANTTHDKVWVSQLLNTGIPESLADVLPSFDPGSSIATRNANKQVLDAIEPHFPSIIAGSADLTGNTGTDMVGSPLTKENPGGRKLYYGVREHAMGSIANGMALHGGVFPVVGTFLVFADYMRPSVRMAALSKAKVAFVWSHDSIGVGEDGPTHQPVEQIASLRAIPDFAVIRPADANEVSQAWVVAAKRAGPTGLILSRQNLPILEGTNRANQVEMGAYTLIDAPSPAVILAGTGSEVQLCVEAAAALAEDGVPTRVVSMPCWELFEEQTDDYRYEVLLEDVPIVGVEAGISLGWERYADLTVTVDRFGSSAPGDVAMKQFGFTAANVESVARSLLL